MNRRRDRKHPFEEDLPPTLPVTTLKQMPWRYPVTWVFLLLIVLAFLAGVAVAHKPATASSSPFDRPFAGGAYDVIRIAGDVLGGE